MRRSCSTTAFIATLAVACAALSSEEPNASGQLDSQVLAGAFDDQAQRFEGPFLIMRESTNLCFARDESGVEWAKGAGLSRREREALVDHERRNVSPAHLPIFPVAAPSRFVLTKELEDPSVGKAPMLLHFSFPGRSRDLKTAVVCVGASWSALGAEWDLVILEQRGTKWHVRQRFPRLRM